ncbi:phosphotransferase family protein [Actinomycetospora atypica]|uniref:Phosphotransferase family protein n=1 Tax=Actinomycetospora atypica TaxID=1290095 RepID=A0ABV9YG12_9PSEU
MTAPRGGDELAAALAAVLGARTVTGLQRITAGASRETWAFDADDRALVLRRDPPGLPQPEGMRREAECFRAAAAVGIPVPALVAAGDGSDAVGTPYLVLARLEGETLPTRLLREDRFAAARAGLARELGRVLARIHAIDPGKVPSLDRVDDRLARLRAEHDAFGEPRPAVEAGLRWLADHPPVATAPAVVHGDFRHGNLLVGEDGLRGVLDWELAHVGDPREDLGWMCARVWRFGAAPEVGGFGSREDLFAGYDEVAGAAPDPAAVHWWEVFACVHWAVICRMQAQRHLSGAEPSVELAVLGRRAVEAEHDALLLLGLVEPGTTLPDEPCPSDSVAPHPVRPPTDRPTVDELLAAVEGFLVDELEPADDRSRYLARVARTSLAVVRRELALGPGLQRDHAAALARTGCHDDAELAAGLRSGTLRLDDEAVAAAVRSGTLGRLAVANPRYPITRPRR